MAKPETVACFACGKEHQKAGPFVPPICDECWQLMAPAERAGRHEAERVKRQLLELKHAVENNEYLAKQTARLAKTLEALLRELKEPFAGLNDLVERWNRRIEQEREEYDEGERWKEGRADDDDE